MDYNPDEILQLIDAVESQGGAHLGDRCAPDLFNLDIPNDKGGVDSTTFATTGCGNETRFVVTYDPSETVQLPNTAGLGNTISEETDIDSRIASVHSKPMLASAPVSGEEYDAQVSRGARFVTVCAVDDDVSLWPRFSNSTKDDDAYFS